VDFPRDQLDELKQLHGDVLRAEEGGFTLLFLPQLALPETCTPSRVDALLCPMPRDGYSSRLFFAEKPSSPRSLNWNGTARILERNWYAFSWRFEASGTLRLAQLVQMHLRGLR
jgi:hypothetical protein